jgi:ELWxxDGT repeat protein
MPRWFVLFLLGLAVAVAPAAGAGPYLIADLNTSRTTALEPAARPGADGVELGGFLYFAADDGQHGLELWRTDGTAERTELVSDICPGPCSSGPSYLKVFGDLIGFKATDELHGHELWVSDGTREGTRMASDLCPGRCSSSPSRLIAVGDRLFFVANSKEPGGRELLAVTDGTAAGTRIVLHPADRYWPIRMVGEIQGRLAFIGPGTAYYSALWWSDGTPEGTFKALDLCTSPDCSRGWTNPIVVGNRIVFWGDAYGQEIWSSDGTASGTRKIGNAFLPIASDTVLWKGSLYFATVGGLWQTDGTREGTRQLRSFPGWETRAHSPLPFDDVLLFVAGDATEGMTLWQTLGTPESTKLVSDPAPNDKLAQLGPLTRVGDRVLFPVTWLTRSEIWETDGTAAGTRRLASVCGQSSPVCRPGQTAPAFPVAVQGRYLFGLAEEAYGFELWTVDAAGSRLLRDIRRDAGSSRYRWSYIRYDERPLEPAREVAALGTRLIFSARTAPDKMASLWASDGTAAGTLEIGPGISWPSGMVRIGDRLWLRGSTTAPPWFYGKGLWSTDGTAAGTIALVPDVELSGPPGGRPGLVLAGAGDWDTGREPWVSDGTPGGTRLLYDINTQPEYPPFPGDGPIPGSSDPAQFAPLGGSVLFTADDGLIGREPWITDGTAAGTRLLLDINPLSGGPDGYPYPLSSNPSPFVKLRARTFFAADDGVAGRELWSTDGTTAGTVRARDLLPGPAGSNPRDLVKVRTNLFFLADAGASDALWTVAPAGTVKRVSLLGNDRRASSLVAAGNRLFFVVDSPATGPELWTSDGTRPGTRLVREIRPGALGSYPQELTAVDGLLLFAADDGAHGLEPWVTDGTAAGTRLLADLAPGVGASGPANFTVAGDLVGFDADDGVHGREMWGVRKADLAH